ncbi:MAG TPA: MFS transporter [Nitrospiraceae bacterium]|nr:MFS transporter [Nitrospiraceae bacterium]
MKARIAALLKADEQELAPLAWSFFYFFCLLCGYYILRPVRDEMAIESGVRHLPWMMTVTFLVLLFSTPVFGWLSARFPRRRLLPIVYLFFAANLLLFYVLMKTGIHSEWVARAFFVWLSVFNLFVVSVFWSFMVDLFSADQGKRLFGMIAAGGSVGALVGPLVTAVSTYVFPVANLMMLSAMMLLICVWCIRRLDVWARTHTEDREREAERPIGGGVLAGMRLALSSPYLAGIAGYVALLAMTATVLYLEQAQVVGSLIPSPLERTRLYATIDVSVSALTFLTQTFATSRVPLRIALMLLPAASLIGFALLSAIQTVALFAAFIIIRRVSEYALAKPGREVLFTIVSREEKYKAKNFIDTAISRGGDATTGWLVSGVKALGVTAALMAWMLVPLMALWCWLAWWLSNRTLLLRRDHV